MAMKHSCNIEKKIFFICIIDTELLLTGYFILSFVSSFPIFVFVFFFFFGLLFIMRWAPRCCEQEEDEAKINTYEFYFIVLVRIGK